MSHTQCWVLQRNCNIVHQLLDKNVLFPFSLFYLGLFGFFFVVHVWDDVNLYWWNAQKTTFLRLRFSYTAATMYVSHFSSFSHGLCSTTEIDYENEIVFLYFLISSSLAYFMQKMEKTTTSGCLYIGDRAKHFHNPQLSVYVFLQKGCTKPTCKSFAWWLLQCPRKISKWNPISKLAFVVRNSIT